MKFFLTLSFTLSLAVLAAAEKPTLVASVARQLDHAAQSLMEGRHEEAQAYSEGLMSIGTISVWIAPEHKTVGQRALAVWEQALGVAFVEGDESTSDLRIDYRDSVTNYGRRVMGLATVSRKVMSWGNDRFTHRTCGTLEVSLTDPHGNAVADDVLLSTTLHEIGHFLGLEDTMVRGRVMGPIDLIRPVLEPAHEEVDCLLALRAEASSLLDQVALKIAGRQPGH